MKEITLHLLLADDDMDDCDFFKEALESISNTITLSTVNDGVALINYLLEDEKNHPDILFLDLNMPKKSGMECLAEIKASEKLSHIPVIIYSTSLDKTVAYTLFDLGAHYYIQKPVEFSNLKKVISKAVMLFSTTNLQPRQREHFIIKP